MYRKKLINSWVKSPRPKRNLETDHLRPSNLATRTLRSVESTPSKFGHDPHPVRRGLVAVVKCSVRKARFPRCPGRLWNRTREARALCGFNTTKGKNCSVFCFPIPSLSALGPVETRKNKSEKTDFAVFGRNKDGVRTQDTCEKRKLKYKMKTSQQSH